MSVRRHTGYNLAGALAPLALSFITVPFYLEVIGAERYGVLSIAWLLLGYFGLFDLGLGRATSFRIAALRAAPPEARATAFWAALWINLGMGAVGAAVLWGASALFFAQVFKIDESLRPEVLGALPFLAASVPIATLTGVLTGALQGREKFLEVNLVSALSTALFQLVPLGIAWFLGPNLSMLLAAALSVRLLAVLVLGYRCQRELLRGQRPRTDTQEARALLKYGGSVTITSIVSPLLNVVDRLVIGALLGAASVTVYALAYQLTKQLAVIPSALTTALFPRMAAISEEERRTTSRLATQTLASLLTLPVLGGIFLLEPFLRIWVGAETGGLAAGPARILLIAFWFNAFALVPFTDLQASGKPGLVNWAHLAELAVYLPGLWVGLHLFGLPGSAFAFGARCAADYALLTRMAGHGWGATPAISANFALLVLAALAADRLTPNDIGWWMSGGALGVVTTILGWSMLPKPFQAELAGRLRRIARPQT